MTEMRRYISEAVQARSGQRDVVARYVGDRPILDP